MKRLYICLLLGGFLSGCGSGGGTDGSGSDVFNPHAVSSSPQGVFVEEKSPSESEISPYLAENGCYSGWTLDSRLQPGQVFKKRQGSLSNLGDIGQFYAEFKDTVLTVDQEEGSITFRREFSMKNGQQKNLEIECLGNLGVCREAEQVSDNIHTPIVEESCWVDQSGDYQNQRKSRIGTYQFSDGPSVNAYKIESIYIGDVFCDKLEEGRWVGTSRLNKGKKTVIYIMSVNVPKSIGSTCGQVEEIFSFSKIELDTGEVIELDTYELLGGQF